MTQLNQWLSYGYGPFTLTVCYGDLQTLHLVPQEPARSIAPSFNAALTARLPSPFQMGWRCPRGSGKCCG
jgi:hypothetical protein